MKGSMRAASADQRDTVHADCSQIGWASRQNASIAIKGSDSGPACMPSIQPHTEPGEDPEEDEGDSEDNRSERRQQKDRPRKPHLQGRFSGRLETKDDEKKLADECRLLGPLLGGVGKRGEKSRLTLAKIVRGIAAGEVRRHCEDRERALTVRLSLLWPDSIHSMPASVVELALVQEDCLP